MIDYSQWKAFIGKCPWYWYEQYVKGWKVQPSGYADTALTFGSVVHHVLEQYRGVGVVSFPAPDVLNKLGCSQEWAGGAYKLATEYIAHYYAEPFVLSKVEIPIVFEVLGTQCVAKVDNYFHVDEATNVGAGPTGEQLTLEPGWWLRDYKTKSANLNQGYFVLGWETNMQAEFQMLALKTVVGEYPKGLLIDVLEKPRQYIPMRKCKGCGESYELWSYISTGEGGHACPMCGFKQTVSPYKPKTEPVSTFFRIRVTRTIEELEHAQYAIRHVGVRMNAMVATHGRSEVYNDSQCVHAQFGPCEFLSLHKYGTQTGHSLVQIADPLAYLGLEKISAAPSSELAAD
jgi:hypothetical protein